MKILFRLIVTMYAAIALYACTPDEVNSVLDKVINNNTTEIIVVTCQGNDTLASLVNNGGMYYRLGDKCGANVEGEPVIINNSGITIDGNGKSYTSINRNSAVIKVNGKNALIKNITLTSGKAGIHVNAESGSAVINNVHTAKNKYGIVMGFRIPEKDLNIKEFINTRTNPDATLNISDSLDTRKHSNSITNFLISSANASSHDECDITADNGFVTVENQGNAILCGENSSSDNVAGVYLTDSSTLSVRKAGITLNGSGVFISDESEMHVECDAKVEAGYLYIDDNESKFTCATTGSCASAPSVKIPNVFVPSDNNYKC